MPNPSGKMNAREKQICSRVKELRERLRWSQHDLAELIGISLNQLASIEYGRTPLRYEIAWKLRQFLGISLSWLCAGEFLPDTLEVDELPIPELSGLPEDALLSEVSDRFNRSVPRNLRKGLKGEKIKLIKTEIKQRTGWLMAFRQEMEIWIARVPTGRINDFADSLIEFANNWIKNFPEDSSGLINARHDALLWEKIRLEAASRLAGITIIEKTGLTHDSQKSNNQGVKSEIQMLLERVKRKASQPGAKAKLARALDVAPARISEWLSGVKEPGGHYTLKLLKWVEQQERQK